MENKIETTRMGLYFWQILVKIKLAKVRAAVVFLCTPNLDMYLPWFGVHPRKSIDVLGISCYNNKKTQEQKMLKCSTPKLGSRIIAGHLKPALDCA